MKEQSHSFCFATWRVSRWSRSLSYDGWRWRL